jgi:hypothetical protein
MRSKNLHTLDFLNPFFYAFYSLTF